MKSSLSIILAACCLLVASLASAQATADPDSLRLAITRLDEAGREAGRAYAPLRRGAPAAREQWRQLDDLTEAVGEVATAAGRIRAQVTAIAGQDREALAVRRREYRRRLARVDSLTVVAATIADRPWDHDLPDEAEEAALLVTSRARQARQLADQLVAAADDLAYAVGVTEGVGRRSLSLSLVGILVVFVVLTMISLIVGGIRRLDDDWQQQERAKEVQAFDREPSIDATTLVLIAAACATVITGRFRVRRIRRLLSPRQRRTPWSAQGRLILQGSHTVVRKK